jgi:cysteine desulfurase
VIAAMEPFWRDRWGNASSVHAAGREARRAVESAREEVAALLGANEPEEIVFTSGGTEADALAIFSARASGRRGIAITAVEHPAVVEPARALAGEGFELSVLSVLPTGGLDVERAATAIDPSVRVVSVMSANNEYGGIFPIAAMAERAHAAGALFHTDAVAAAGKVDVSARQGADMISISAHKIGGPKGVGALFVRRGVDLRPLFPGGGQERRRRGGTENVAGIVGFGEAARLARSESPAERPRITALRDAFEDAAARACGAIQVWGRSAPRIDNTSAIAFPGASGEAIAIALDLAGIAVSVGSACSSGSVSPSPSILALGASRAEAKATVRFSFGAGNSPDDVDAVVGALSRIVRKDPS